MLFLKDLLVSVFKEAILAALKVLSELSDHGAQTVKTLIVLQGSSFYQIEAEQASSKG